MEQAFRLPCPSLRHPTCSILAGPLLQCKASRGPQFAATVVILRHTLPMALCPSCASMQRSTAMATTKWDSTPCPTTNSSRSRSPCCHSPPSSPSLDSSPPSSRSPTGAALSGQWSRAAPARVLYLATCSWAVAAFTVVEGLGPLAPLAQCRSEEHRIEVALSSPAETLSSSPAVTLPSHHQLMVPSFKHLNAKRRPPPQALIRSPMCACAPAPALPRLAALLPQSILPAATISSEC